MPERRTIRPRPQQVEGWARIKSGKTIGGEWRYSSCFPSPRSSPTANAATAAIAR